MLQNIQIPCLVPSGIMVVCASKGKVHPETREIYVFCYLFSSDSGASFVAEAVFLLFL